MSRLPLRYVGFTLVFLIGFTVAGPAGSAEGCSEECSADSKFQYEEGKTYVYSYEASNNLYMEGSSELSTRIKATVEVTRIGSCEMALQIVDAKINHGSSFEEASEYIEQLKRNPAQFSWNDGKISKFCPHAQDSSNVNNIKRGILSALQNTMKTLDHDTIIRETDVLGSCDTEYKIKTHSVDKITIYKKKIMSTCSNHVKGRTGIPATPYESISSIYQHLPLVTNHEYSCNNTVNAGINEEIVCSENAIHKPLSDYGYSVKAHSKIRLRLLSTEAAKSDVKSGGAKPESLVYVYEPHPRENLDADAVESLREICNAIDSGASVHKLLYAVRGLSEESLKTIYDSLKGKSICKSARATGIFLDTLKAAATEGAVRLLSSLVRNGELSAPETLLWLAAMPFASDPEEGAVQAASELISKDTDYKQAILSVPALAHKYCTHHPDCESSPGVKSVIAKLEEYLGSNCSPSSSQEKEEVIAALKGFGNLGYFSEKAEAVLKCASSASNDVSVRIAALDSFRRTPCSEKISSKLLAFYEDQNELDEIRLAALITLSKCPSPEIVRRIARAYKENKETSKQVEVFTWSYLENLKESNDPLKQKARYAASEFSLQAPSSVDLTKFSRNFERSRFLSALNLGYAFEGNLIHSQNSFLPRSLNMDFTVNIFGNQLKFLELGLRVENLEHNLEKVFGPRGFVSRKLRSLQQQDQADGSTQALDPLKARIQSLRDKVNLKPKHPPSGIYYIRILGTEMRWRQVDSELIDKIGSMKIEKDDIIDQLQKHANIDAGHTFFIFDNSIIYPSLTGKAYRFAANGSVTLSLEADRKMNIKKMGLTEVILNLDGRYKPRASVDVSGSLTIYGEDYEPGVKILSTLNGGQDFSLKLDLDKGPSIHAKLDFPSGKSKLMNLRRTFYELNEGGEKEIQISERHDVSYCTKHINNVIGLQFCGNMKIPHLSRGDGKFMMPLAGALEMSLEMEKTDSSMNGYELHFQLPDRSSSTKIFKIHLDTPNSKINRKFQTEFVLNKESDEESSATLNLYTPIYHFEADATCVSRNDKLELKVNVLGDGTRRYSLVLDMEKHIKGARLSEYKPTVTLTLPSTDPVTAVGSFIFSRGRKEMISFTLNSDNILNSPVSIKGNVAKEGSWGKFDSSSNLHLASDVTITTPSETYKMRSGYTRSGFNINFESDIVSSPKSGFSESAQFKAALKDVSFSNSLSFTIEHEMKNSRYPKYNFHSKYDFSSKLYDHLKNELVIRYGEDFTDEQRVIKLIQINRLDGDFYSFHRLNFENKLAISMPFLEIDKAVFLIANWDLSEKPNVHIDIGAKMNSDRYVKAEVNFESYRPLTERPIKYTSNVQILYYGYEFKYTSEVQETSPNLIQGREVMQTHPGHQITLDFVYAIRSTEQVLYHEYECTISVPKLVAPIQHKMYLKRSSSVLEFGTRTDTGNTSPFVLDLKLNDAGPSELSLDLPFLVGKMIFTNEDSATAFQVDFKTVGRDPQKIVGSGQLSQIDSGRKLTADINYANSINVVLNGDFNKDILHGKHELQADFTGKIEPMTIVCFYEFKEGILNSYVKYLRSTSEKLKLDVKGKYIYTDTRYEVEYGMFVTSPYKAFDGKELYYHFLLESTDINRSFETEYRIKPGPVTGYVSKFTYNRKRGWPGHAKLNMFATLNRRTLYENSVALVYGDGKYSFKTSIVPSLNRKFDFDTTAELAAKYVSLQHSVSTSWEYLRLVRLHAVADLRDSENSKVQSGIEMNSYKVYDLNATMSFKSITDFDMQAKLFGNLAPSIHMYSKTHNANQVIKYTLSVEKDSVEIMSGKGEAKKRKRGFTGDITLSFKGKEILNMNFNNEVKSQKERNYNFKIKSFYRTYSIKVNSVKDKQAIKNTWNFCKNENDYCITIISQKEEEGDTITRKITYRRADIELVFDRIYQESPGLTRRSLVVSSGEKRYGYDIRYGLKDRVLKTFFGVILPKRKVSVENQLYLSLEKPRLTIEMQSDSENHPDRKLKVDIEVQNEIRTSAPSRMKLLISHPVLEKDIEFKSSANYDGKRRSFEAEGFLDYSNNPEENILSKLQAQRGPQDSIHATFSVYLKDENHHVYTMKANTTREGEVDKAALEYVWTGNGGSEENAFILLERDSKQKHYSIIYHRPRLDFSISATAVQSQGLHGDLNNFDILMKYNDKVTKAKFFRDLENNCCELNILGDEGETTRHIKVCADTSNKVLFSIITTSKDNDMIVFDYSLEFIRTSFSTLSIRHHWNPEFLGGAMFQLTQLGEELKEAGFGTHPPSESPDYKRMSDSFYSKVLNPMSKLITDEIKSMFREICEEASFLKDKAVEYYKNLPSTPLAAMVRRILKVLKPVYDEFVDDVWESLEDMKERIIKRFQDLLAQAKEYREKLYNDCDEIPECLYFKKAILERDPSQLLKIIRNVISRLPEPLQRYLEKDGIIEQHARKIYVKVEPYIKKFMDLEQVKSAIQLLQKYRLFVREQLLKGFNYLRETTLEKIRNSYDFTEIRKILHDASNFDFSELRRLFKEYLENFAGSFRLPISHLFKVHTLEGERGVFNFDVYYPQMFDFSFLKSLITELVSNIHKLVTDAKSMNLKQLFVKIKRVSDLQFIPPYREKSIIVSDQHYITFDKTFYDFAGECIYLLADDMEDGNFSLVLTPMFNLEVDKATGKREHGLGVIVKDSAVLVNLQSKQVKAGDKVIDLPYFTKDLSVTRRGDVILIDGDFGLQVTCHTVHELCSATLNGFYYGKTAGLFGTYDYEPANDFRRPKGQIPNSVTTFAKSWDISKGCKTKNLAQEGKAAKNSEIYDLCAEYFEKDTSPLSACFSEVNPEKFLDLCYRHLSIGSDTTKALCNVAAAFAIECENNYIELNLPPKCVTCAAPDGSVMKHGEKKKYENFASKSSEIVFVVEANTCNDVLLKEMESLARSIDRELTNEGYSNNMFGLVVFGSSHEPLSYTYNGQLLFPISGIGNTVKRINLSDKPSSSALEAVRLAVTYPFLSTTSKSIVLMACSPCNYDYKSLQYPVIQQILFEHEIVLHVISKHAIKLRKVSSKERNIIGLDAETVYNSRDVAQKDLVGEPSLRAQVAVPKDACIALAQDVNGSFFSSTRSTQDSEIKLWRSVFSRRLLKSAGVSSCRWCDCSSAAGHVAKAMCRPCTTRRPKLPLSVCITCALPELFTSIYSYLLHVIL